MSNVKCQKSNVEVSANDAKRCFLARFATPKLAWKRGGSIFKTATFKFKVYVTVNRHVDGFGIRLAEGYSSDVNRIMGVTEIN